MAFHLESCMINKVLKNDLEYIWDNLGASLDRLKHSRILITGFGGFLGFYFLKFLTYFHKELEIKEIICVDKFILGKKDWVLDLEDNFPKLINVYDLSIASEEFKKNISLNNIDYVIHAASIASPTFYRQFPLDTIDANIWGLRSLLDKVIDECKTSIKGFLFFSSSEIYGDPSQDAIPTHEDYRGLVSCHGPRACYDESKRFGETICWVFAQEHNLPITIARPFNNYGPGMSLFDKRLPADLAKKVIYKEDIIIYSDGKPTRTFCYIADAIIGYFKCLTHGSYNYFNIGNDDQELSVFEIASIYQSKAKLLFQTDLKVKFQESLDSEYLTDNPNRRCPDLSKARSILEYNPQISVDQGVERYLMFAKDNHF